ncbi:MAG: PKD domain-containing protein [Chitinophagales bacterium]|nr:PKD domain-containing protein [Chitinophagales bacterium]
MNRSVYILLLVGFCMLFHQQQSQAQQIVFADQLPYYCDTICGTLIVEGIDYSTVEVMSWSIDGQPVFTTGGNSLFELFGCFHFNQIDVFIIFEDGSTLQLSEYLSPSIPPIIFETYTDASQFCPAANPPPGSTIPNANCDAIVCPGTTVTYDWEFEGDIYDIAISSVSGGPLIGASNIVISPNFDFMQITWDEPGIYSFSVAFLGYCGSAIRSFCTEVLEEPIASFNSIPEASNDTIYACQGQSISLENTSQFATSYLWNFGNESTSTESNPIITYNQAGTYTLELTAYNDCLCDNSTSKTVIVEEAIIPVIDCISTICENSIATYEATANCSGFLWDVSDNGTIIDGGGPTDNYLTINWSDGPEGIIELTLMDCVDGETCNAPAQLRVPIISEDNAIVGDDNVCRGQISYYQVPLYEGTSFDWEVSPYGTILEGDGSNQIIVEWFNGSVPSGTEHWVAITYENCYLGCGGQDTLDIFINPDFYTSGPLETCQQDSSTHTAFDNPGSNFINCHWEVLDNNNNLIWSSSSPSHEVMIPWNVTPGTYQIYASPEDTSSNCGQSYRTLMNVISMPEITGNIEGDSLICPGEVYTFSASANEERSNFLWTITDGNTTIEMEGDAINYSFGSNPPYAVSVYAINPFGCASTSVIKNLSPLPAPLIIGALEACVETTTSYTATPAYSDFSYEWNIIPAERGSIVGPKNDPDIEILWHQEGPVEVVVAICGQTDTIELMVHPLPEPMVNAPDAVCPGEQAVVQFIGTYDAYSWLNAAGNEVGNIATALLHPGTYQLAVTDENACMGTTIFNINEHPEPSVNITTPDPNVFCNTTISTRLFANATANGYTYQWYRDGIPVGSDAPEHTAADIGTYIVQVTDLNNCTAVSNPIDVLEDCTLGPPLPPGCPATPTFDIIAAAECDVRSYQNTSPGVLSTSWEFDDPNSGFNNFATGSNPTHTYSGVGFYRVRMTSAFSPTGDPDSIVLCTTYRVDTVLVKADFTADTVCIGNTTTFEDLSTFMPMTSISSWQWDFGDPSSGINNTSSLPNPSHTFSGAGLYTVILSITAPTGCTSTQSRLIEIKDIPVISFELPSASCEDIALPFNALTENDITGLQWLFGDPDSGAADTATVANTFHDYQTPGNYTITLSAESIYGCTNDTSQLLTIVPNTLSGNIIINPSSLLCEGDTAILYAPPGGTSRLWNTGATMDSILVTQTGTYSVTITDATGCPYSPQEVAVTIQSPPETVIQLVEYNHLGQIINYVYDDYEACEGTDITLGTTISQPNISYLWSTGATASTISFLEERDELLSEGSYTFDVTITDNTTGCSSVAPPFEVIIHPNPEFPFITADPIGPNCENTPVTLEVSNIQDSITYVWNNGVEGISTIVSTGGQHFVTASNAFGCETQSFPYNIIPGPDISLVPNGCYTRCNPDTICLPSIPDIVAYQWLLDGVPIFIPSSTPPELEVTSSGSYQLQMENTAGCTLLSDPLDIELFDGVGSFFGQVWVDVNNNGLIDNIDTLYTGAIIDLYQTNILQASTSSNHLGNYSFPNIETNDYTLILDTLSIPSWMQAVYTQVDTSLVGCDNQVPINWLLQDLCQGDTIFEILTACDSLAYNGVSIYTDTSFINTYSSLIGCDSIVQTTITINNNSDTTFINLTACEGDTILYDGLLIAAGESTSINYNNFSGCDSTVVVNIAALSSTDSTITFQACQGSIVTYNGTNLIPGEQQTFSFTNIQGCDSSITVIVEELLPSDTTLMLGACEGNSVNYNNTDIAAGQQIDFVFTNAVGCDSTVTVIVEAAAPSDSTLLLQTCEGTSTSYNGTDIPAGQQQDFTFTNAVGCDSIVTVIVQALLPSDNTLTLQACEGASASYNGTNIPAGQQQDFTFTNAVGCDSIVTVTVQTLLPNDNALTLQACEGTSASYNGTDIPAGQQQDFTFTNAVGCDSIVTVIVQTLLPSDNTLTLQACEGTSAPYNGTDIPAGQQQDFTFTNAVGCDSIVTVIVQTLLPSDNTITLQACEGTSAPYNGTDIPAGQQQDFTFTNAVGCDSIVTVIVEAVEILQNSLELTACEGDSISYNGQPIAAGDTQIFTYMSTAGCDSIVTVEVLPLMGSTNNLSLTTCAGEGILYNDSLLFGGAQASFVFTNAVGCDSVVNISVNETAAIAIDISTSNSCPNIASGIMGIEYLPGSASPLAFSIDGSEMMSNFTYTGLVAGAHTLIAQDDNGCEQEYEFNIESDPPLVIQFDQTPISCEQQIGQIIANILSGDDGELQLNWNEGTTGAMLSSNTPGNYQLQAINGCEELLLETALEDQRPNEISLIYIPNAFSPNDDGINDTFRGYTAPKAAWLSYHLMIFDRWGDMLFETNDPALGWDGTLKGELMNDAVHVWHIDGEIESCGRIFKVERKGEVVIVR